MSRMTNPPLAVAWLVCWAAAAGAADKPPIDLSPATPEQVLNHHLVRSAQLGPATRPADRVVPMPWRTEDDVVEGWDWSLPPGVVGVRFHFYATVAYRLSKDRRTPVAPDWLAKYKIPLIDMTAVEGRFQLFNYPIWDERYHRRYLRVIEQLGKSGIPKMKALRIVYVGAISKSWGEEMYIPGGVAEWCQKHTGLTPQALETCLRQRLDAWAKAFRGVEHKLAWVGAGAGGVGKPEYDELAGRIIEHAYELGMGQRCGFVENYLYHLHNPSLGQTVDEQGYLHVDEACPPIATGRAFGDENEEYGRYWTGRFGPLETHAYRYHQSMLRALQMRRNYLWMSSASIDTDPALTAYVSLAMGRRVTDSPDAFCHLRESTVRAGAAGKEGKTFAVRNFERWLTQRDRDGCRTKPAVKAAQHEMMWMVPPGHKFDWIARRTDLAGGNGRIGLALDDRFLSGGPHPVAVKITYHDLGRGRWHLVYARLNNTLGRRTIQCNDTRKPLTATFHLDDACFPAKAEAFDFHLQAESQDATISFIRVIKKTPWPSSS